MGLTAEPVLPDATEIERILRAILDALEEGYRRISELARAVRAEYDRGRAALEQVKTEALRCIEQVDELAAKSRVARYDL
ncbi:MAG: hypothetical protein AB1609_23110, partial [Bacillota bacterium]